VVAARRSTPQGHGAASTQLDAVHVTPPLQVFESGVQYVPHDTFAHETAPLHAPKPVQQTEVAFPLLVTFPPHAPPPMQSTLHSVVALHVMSCPHAWYPMQSTSHVLPAQSTVWEQEPPPSQVIRHEPASHEMASLHAWYPEQPTWQSCPPQETGWVHEPPPEQSIAQRAAIVQSMSSVHDW